MYKYKSLQSLKIESLPQNAGAFRSWKNVLVTKMCSIDITGRDVLLDWILRALDANADLASGMGANLPRLDAFVAAALTEPKHLHGEMEMQFQAYVENCQLQRRSPKGREILQMIAKGIN